jgi:hypothetical protein
MLRAERIAMAEETDRAAWASIDAEVADREEKTARLRAARLERESEAAWQPVKKPARRSRLPAAQ